MNNRILGFLPVLILAGSLEISQAATPAGQILSFQGLPNVEQLDLAAEQGADRFRGMINEKNYQTLGFASRGEGFQTQLGFPIRHYFVRLDRLRNFQAGRDPMGLFDSRSTVTYPLVGGGEAKSGVGLVWKNDQWQAASLGGAAMVKSWYGRRRRAAARLKLDPGAFFTVRVNALNMEFLGYLDSQSSLMLIPEKDDSSLGLWEGEPVPGDQLFLKLAPKAVNHGDKAAS